METASSSGETLHVCPRWWPPHNAFDWTTGRQQLDKVSGPWMVRLMSPHFPIEEHLYPNKKIHVTMSAYAICTTNPSDSCQQTASRIWVMSRGRKHHCMSKAQQSLAVARNMGAMVATISTATAKPPHKSRQCGYFILEQGRNPRHQYSTWHFQHQAM